VSASPPNTIILGDGVTVQDVSRMLEHSGFAINNTIAPHLFVIKRNTDRRMPAAVVEFEPPPFLRRQAD
jgi:hypothetical protein